MLKQNVVVCHHCRFEVSYPQYGTENERVETCLRTGITLNSLQATYFQQLEASLASDLADSQKVLDRVDATKVVLQAAHDRLKDFKCRIRSLFCPARALPAETLENILSFLPDQRDVVGAAAACSRWRAVALSSPRLWSSLVIDLRNFKGQEPWSFSMIPEFLRRSKTLPLTLEIFESGHTLPGVPGPLDAVAATLGLCSNRLTNLSIDVAASGPISEPEMQVVFPALEVLRVTSCPVDGLKDFQHAPRLQTLVVERSFITRLPKYLWHIRTLRVVDCRLWVVAFLLGSYTSTAAEHEVQIIACTSTALYSDTSFTVSATSLTFIHGMLEICETAEDVDSDSDTDSAFDHERLLELFTYLSAPELRDLTLSGYRYPDILQSPELYAFVQSCKKLKKLDIGTGPRGSWVKEMDIIDLLRCAPSITWLGIYDEDSYEPYYARLIQGTLLQALTVPKDIGIDDEILLPCLESIDFTLSRSWADQPEESYGCELVDMIASRRQSSSALGPQSPPRARLQEVQLAMAQMLEVEEDEDEDDNDEDDSDTQRYSQTTAVRHKAYIVEDAIGTEVFTRLSDMRKDGLTLITLEPKHHRKEAHWLL